MTAPAAIVAKMDLRGATDLARGLRAVGDLTTAKSIMRKGLRKGANVARPNIRGLIHDRTGRLSGSIKVRAGYRNRRNQVSVAITTGEATFVGDTYYGGMVNWGHLTGKRGQSGKVRLKNGKFRNVATGKARRKVPGEHFMEYGFDEVRDAVLATIEQSIAADIESVLAGRGGNAGGGA